MRGSSSPAGPTPWRAANERKRQVALQPNKEPFKPFKSTEVRALVFHNAVCTNMTMNSQEAPPLQGAKPDPHFNMKPAGCHDCQVVVKQTVTPCCTGGAAAAGRQAGPPLQHEAGGRELRGRGGPGPEGQQQGHRFAPGAEEGAAATAVSHGTRCVVLDVCLLHGAMP